MVAIESFYKVNLETELKIFSKLRVEDIEEIQAWLKTQPHLPPLIDVQVAHFLHASYYDINVAKTAMEHYYTFKTTMTEFFNNWDPQLKTTYDFANNVILAAFLPKMSPTDGQVMILKLRDTNLDLYNFNLSVKWLLMSVTALMLQEGQQSEFKIVYDATGYTMSHVMRNPLSSVRNYLEFGQKASAIRVVEIHFINSSSVVKKLISLVKPFMNKHIMSLLSFHTSGDGFFKNISPDITPTDYGGSGPSLETLHNENVQRVLSMRDALIAHCLQKSDESKRSGKKKKTKVENDFKKLELD